MKKVFLILISTVILIVLAASLLLNLYEDDIQRQVDKTIEEYVDADIYYDPGSFKLSLFQHFPHPSASLGNFGVVGRNRFAGDTLISIRNFGLTVDLFSLFGKQTRLKAVDLDHPRIFVKVLEDGITNYDIVKSSEEDSVNDADGQVSALSLGIDSWSINQGMILYDDRQLSFFALLEGINHKGGGNFTQNNFDMHTISNMQKVVLEYGGVKLLDGQQLRADVTMNMNLKDFIFTFKKNSVYVNDLGVSFSGFFEMPEEEIKMDFSFATEDAGIKSLYSLIPAVYRSDYEEIEASGTLALEGKVKGIYSESRIPGFNVTLRADNGMIKYPDFPLPIKDINLNMTIRNEDGLTDHTEIDIKALQMLIGRDPVDAHILIRNLEDYDMNADIKARIDLKNLSEVFPVQDMKLGGVFSLNLQANGRMDTLKKIIPVIEAHMSLQDGYFSNSMLPKPIEKLFMNTRVVCPSGKLRDLVVSIDSIEMKMDTDRFTAHGTVSNPEDYQWDIFAKGRLNLQAINEMVSVEGIRYEGILIADVSTKGRYSDLDAGRYKKIPTSGHMTIENLKYEDEALPHNIVISSATGTFSPEHFAIDHLSGNAGKSDFSLSGSVNRYMDYLFGENEVLEGNMRLNSKLLDVNEWMEQAYEAPEEASSDSVQMEIPVIPNNIDFEFRSNIEQINYDNLTLKKVHGVMIIREGKLVLKPLSFETLGGNITMNGQYDTRDQESVPFTYSLNMKGISLPGAYTSFNMVKTFAPMAKAMNGNFSSDFNIEGMMKKDLTPVYQSINGSGSIEIKDALVKSSKVIEAFNVLTGMNISSKNLALNDIKILANMENGRAYVRPFNIHAGGHDLRISGSIGADGGLDYILDTEIEAGEKGQQINALLASLSGKEADSTDTTVKVKINVSGTYENPKLTLAGVTSANGRSKLQSDVKKEISSQAEQVKVEAESQIMEGIGHVLEGDTTALEQQADSLKNILNSDILDDLGEKGENIKNSLQNLFKKKKKDDNQ